MKRRMHFTAAIGLSMVFFLCLPAQAEKISGRVTDVTRTGDGSVHVKVKTETGTVETCLGPRKSLVDKRALPHLGDLIEVDGRFENPDNPAVLVAYEIRLNGRDLTVRQAKPRGKS